MGNQEIEKTVRTKDRIRLSTGYRYEASHHTAIARVGTAFLFAIETTMRTGEIASLRWEHIGPPS